MFRIGRSRDVDLPIASGAVARHHVALTRLLSGAYEAEDLATTNGTRLNGEPLQFAVLKSGDALELDARRFVFEQDALPPPRVDEEVLRVARAGESALEVWLDAQVEADAPGAAALSGAKPAELHAELTEAQRYGSLILEWKRGLIRAAQLRGSSMHTVRSLMMRLLSSPHAKFLERLQVPMFSVRFGLSDASLSALRRITVGPHFTDEDVAATRAAISGVHFFAAPLLEPIELQVFSEAWLHFADDSMRVLRRGRPEHIQGCEVRWGPGWTISATKAFRVNGRKVFSSLLQPGDEVSIGDQRFTFRARPA
ncbi:MAG: FHA domain-containing protein [Archangium sp.]